MVGELACLPMALAVLCHWTDTNPRWAYDNDFQDGSGAVEVQNSFGTSWGDKGFVWMMSYRALEKMSQGQGFFCAR